MRNKWNRDAAFCLVLLDTPQNRFSTDRESVSDVSPMAAYTRTTIIIETRVSSFLLFANVNRFYIQQCVKKREQGKRDEWGRECARVRVCKNVRERAAGKQGRATERVPVCEWVNVRVRACVRACEREREREVTKQSHFDRIYMKYIISSHTPLRSVLGLSVRYAMYHCHYLFHFCNLRTINLLLLKR